MVREDSAGIVPFQNSNGSRRYLLLLSALTKKTLWEFPKGGIEKGEAPERAAVREFTEETGISHVEVIPGFQRVLKYFYKRRNTLVSKRVTYYLGRVGEGEVRVSQEATKYAWLSAEEAAKKIRHKTLLALLKEADDFLARNQES